MLRGTRTLLLKAITFCNSQRLPIIAVIALLSFSGINAQRYELTVRTDGTPGAGVAPNGTVSVQHGQSRQIQVTNVPSGFQFTQWTEEEGDVFIKDIFSLVSEVTLTGGNATVQANFSSTFPTALLSGTISICAGSEAILNLDLTGSGPWDVVYTDGNDLYNLTEINTTPFTFEVSPEITTTYSLISVSDSNDNTGETSGEAVITVDPVPIGGAVTGEKDKILLGQSTGLLTLSGYTGTITRWERRVNNEPWVRIDNTTDTYSEIPETTGIYRYRAQLESGVCATDYSSLFEVTVSDSPVIVNAVYSSSTGNLILYGENLNQGQKIDVSKLTVSNGVYNFNITNQTPDVNPESDTEAIIIISARDKPFMNWIFNNDGFRSRDNNPYNIAAEENWNGPALENAVATVAVFDYEKPSIISAGYNRAASSLKVNAVRLASASNIKDIDVTRFTVTGKNNTSYTLTSESQDVDVDSETEFTIQIGGKDKEEVDKIIDIEGATSSTGHPYNLAANNRWNTPVHPEINISDLAGNQITASGIGNYPPTASDIEITGLMNIGNTVTGTYTYNDLEGDQEGNTVFAWYRADDASGEEEIKIDGANEKDYTITIEDALKYIAFEVTPVAQTGTTQGTPARSQYEAVVNAPPVATNVEISGTLSVGKTLTAVYDYFDPENDPEGETEIKWYRARNASEADLEAIHEGVNYILTIEDENKFIQIQVTPAALSGTSPGEPESSIYYGPVENTLPTVAISGPSDFCEGLPVDLVFSFTGEAPWTVHYTDGVGEFDFTTSSNPHIISTGTGGTYEVLKLSDAEGSEGRDFGEPHILNAISAIILSVDWYEESFNDGDGGWITATPSSDMVNSWTLGSPDNDYFTTPSPDDEIWYTSIINRNAREQSWVMSPCFDFSDIKRPMISFDLWQEFDPDRDGAVLQYTTDNGLAWQNVGGLDSGINWFNSSQITGQPANQSTGWTFSGSDGGYNGWVESRHDLDALKDEKHVRFRFVYGSNGTGLDNRGLAFNNFRISERKKMVLLEHFTNTSSNKSLEANQIVNGIVMNKPDDIANISYHTAFPGYDPFNNQNPGDPAARSFYYGISDVPYSIMDGGFTDNYKYDYTTTELDEKDFTIRSLGDPEFEILIDQSESGQNLNISVEVKSNISQGPLEMTLYTAIVEKRVTASQAGLPGNHVFRNVVRKMLPDAAGKQMNTHWFPGQSQNFTYSWEIGSVFNPENLAVVAFIQNEISGEVYQSAASEEFGIAVSAVHPPMESLSRPDVLFYPNPSSDALFIRLEEPLQSPGILEIYNMTGTLVHSVILNEGIANYEVYTGNLATGAYIFKIKNDYGIKGATRIIIMN